jgi:hypothetical protein
MSKKRIQIIRLMLGLLFGPLIGLLAGVAVLHLRHPEGFGWLDGPISRPLASIMYLYMFAILAYPAMLLLGIPAYIWFRKRNWNSAWHYCLAGFFGCLFSLMAITNVSRLLRATSMPMRIRLFPFGVFHPGLVGIVIGLAFWMITIWRRHNKILQQTATNE